VQFDKDYAEAKKRGDTEDEITSLESGAMEEYYESEDEVRKLYTQYLVREAHRLMLQQAFSAPSKQTQSSNAKDELSSTASINASSTTLIPSSELLASKPRDSTLKREQNSCYEHDNGLMDGLSSWSSKTGLDG
jgi:hypothetical protein